MVLRLVPSDISCMPPSSGGYRIFHGGFCWSAGTKRFFHIEWNSIRLSGPAHGIVTKTVHKTLPGGGGGQGVVMVGVRV